MDGASLVPSDHVALAKASQYLQAHRTQFRDPADVFREQGNAEIGTIDKRVHALCGNQMVALFTACMDEASREIRRRQSSGPGVAVGGGGMPSLKPHEREAIVIGAVQKVLLDGAAGLRASVSPEAGEFFLALRRLVRDEAGAVGPQAQAVVIGNLLISKCLAQWAAGIYSREALSHETAKPAHQLSSAQVAATLEKAQLLGLPGKVISNLMLDGDYQPLAKGPGVPVAQLQAQFADLRAQFRTQCLAALNPPLEAAAASPTSPSGALVSPARLSSSSSSSSSAWPPSSSSSLSAASASAYSSS